MQNKERQVCSRLQALQNLYTIGLIGQERSSERHQAMSVLHRFEVPSVGRNWKRPRTPTVPATCQSAASPECEQPDDGQCIGRSSRLLSLEIA